MANPYDTVDVTKYCRDVDYTFIIFLRWWRDRCQKDYEANGWTDDQILNMIIDMVETPHKFQKEFTQFILEEYKQDNDLKK